MRVAGKRHAGGLIAAFLAGGLCAGTVTACSAAVSTGPVSTGTTSTGTASTGTTSTATACTSQAGSTSVLYGVNYDWTGAAPFGNDNVEPLLSELDPGTLRWPGGTEADSFDWNTGNPTKAKHMSNFSLTLVKLEKAYKATGADPIFDLNVLDPQNRVNTTDQVNMLKAAQADGLPVKYVEIGNELYGGGTFAQAFPSGEAYAKTVAAYVPTLHQDFPGVQVAADAVLNPTNTREQQWNSQLLAGATGADAPDALILHDYPGLMYSPFTLADVPPLFANAYTGIQGLSAAVSSLHGKPVWLTEFNYRGPYKDKGQPNQVTNSYARELYLAELALMLPRVPNLAQADNFTALAGGSTFGAWDNPAKPTLTPGGQAVAMIDAAACNARSSAPITVPGAPTLPGGEPAITGQAFSGPGRPTTALLVNLTRSAQNVPTGADVPAGAPYQQSAGPLPTAQEQAAAALTSGTVSGQYLRLPAYSITLVNSKANA
jgi:hypothetical protein